MKLKMAMTTNVKRALAATRELQNRPLGMEGMGLFWGEPGEGKSTTVAYAVNTLDGIFLRALRSWTVSSMLRALCVELGLLPHRTRAIMVDAIVGRMMEFPQPIFVDEADYLLTGTEMLDTLRDIYDLTGSPVLLIGMEEMARRIQERKHSRLARRITQWVEFRGIDMHDARTLVETVCEIDVADDLLTHLHTAARGNIGRMVTGLSKIESYGRINACQTVSLADWGKRALFYDQPKFARRGA